jgi:hypothetical protein
MRPEDSNRGRMLLIAVTLIALALQAIKLGSRALVLHKWPTALQWGQLALVLWLVFSLWGGEAWARIVSALYYSLAAVAGAVLLCLIWHKMEPLLRFISVLIVALAGSVSLVLWFSGALRSYMAERVA